MSPTRIRAAADSDAFADAVFRGRPFVGAAAQAAGIVTEHELRTLFRRVLPGIYQFEGFDCDVYTRVRSAWLWAPRGAILAGPAAALLHGEYQVAPVHAFRSVDLCLPHSVRAPNGIRIRRLRQPLTSADISERHAMRCTSPERTALDLARWTRDPLAATIAVDALCNVTGTPATDVERIAHSTSGLHGRRRALYVLGRSDHRADSPRETRVRLIIADSSLPQPDLQVNIADSAGRHIVKADLAYRKYRVALLYDGEHHLDREQRDWDSAMTARLFDEGWLDLRITAGMLRDSDTLLRRIAEKLRRQGCPDI
ncbi:hypothetical protein NCCP2495_20730 [Dietzia sp. NCCP-2495]|uniref:hypothetical protein n=1 Tax=Dietzia sp. NCCP-2495 TaxID=2934675 RepID=UPI002231FA16|nr:hypothetical protein [Dietzia sp. NCCP-2495]GLB64194.1 hypothetical protein NCCP2495_20730 [Dietzia sp. NCCP-2495]